MPAPSVQHQGFFVPNAQDVTQPELAEPDRIDFNSLGNAKWGVLSGCKVTVNGSLATVTPGVALVNGVLVDVTGGQNSNVGSGGTQDRFDLVGCDVTGALVTVGGAPSLDPVFPDPPSTVTVFAAVLCTAGGGPYDNNVIDKRVMLADSLKTKLSPSADLIFNKNGSGNLYKVIGDGTTSWNDDVTVRRYDVGVLQISTSLRVDDSITSGGNVSVGKNLIATNRVLGSNLRNDSALPPDASGNPGDIFQDGVTGKAYISQNGHWEEIATTKSSNPVGTVITSLQPPTYMKDLGWIELNGTLITEVEAPALFNVPALTPYISSPPSGPRTMLLPDARRRVLLYSPDDIGRVGGASTFALTTANMPPHVHNTRVLAGGGANPAVRIGRAGTHVHRLYGGEHIHGIDDPGHAHYGADDPLGGGFIVTAWGGQNKIDALFNDRSHTYSVEQAMWTRSARTGIQNTNTNNSGHTHGQDSNGDHDHTATVDPIQPHSHNVQEDTVGSGSAVSFTPAYLAVYCYIKS